MNGAIRSGMQERGRGNGEEEEAAELREKNELAIASAGGHPAVAKGTVFSRRFPPSR